MRLIIRGYVPKNYEFFQIDTILWMLGMDANLGRDYITGVILYTNFEEGGWVEYSPEDGEFYVETGTVLSGDVPVEPAFLNGATIMRVAAIADRYTFDSEIHITEIKVLDEDGTDITETLNMPTGEQTAELMVEETMGYLDYVLEASNNGYFCE